MNQNTSGGGIWGILAAIVAVVVIVGGMIYMIGDISTQREREIAAQRRAEAQIAQAQVQIVQAREDNRTERLQIFALTLKSMTTDHSMELTLLSVGVLLLGILQLVQFMTRPRGNGQ